MVRFVTPVGRRTGCACHKVSIVPTEPGLHYLDENSPSIDSNDENENPELQPVANFFLVYKNFSPKLHGEGGPERRV